MADSSARDVTRAEEEMRLLVEGVKDYAIFRLDRDGLVASWNTGAQLITGYTPAEIIGRPLAQFYSPEEVAAGRPERELEIATTRGRFEEEGWRVRKDGSRFWANVVLTAMYDAHGKLRGFAKVTRDLTDRLREEEARRRLIEERAARSAAEQARQLAENAYQRIEALQALTSAFAEAATRDQVVDAVLRQTVRVAGASGSVIYLLDGDSTYVSQIAAEGVDEGTRTRFAQIPLDARLPVADALRDTRSLFFSSPEEIGAAYPELVRPSAQTATKASAVLPLAVKGRAIGALVLVFAQPRTFEEETRAFLNVMAQHCAQALDRSALYAALDEERQRLNAVLQQMPSAVAIVEAPSGGILLANRQNETIFRLSPEEVHKGIDGTLAARPDASGSAATWNERWPLMRSLRRGEIIRGEEIEIQRGDGTNGFIRVNSAPVRDEHGTIRAGVVTYDDITDARRTEQATRFLAEASKVLSSSLDYEATLEAVTRLAVPLLADWCSVDVVRPDGQFELLGLAHVDPDKVQLARELRRRYPLEPDAPRGVASVVRSGEPELYELISDELLERSARDAEHLALVRQIGLRSMVCVPINTRRGTLGVISFASSDTGRRYSAKDLPLFQELALRAAIAIENALLYRDAQEAVRKRDEFLSVASHELKTPLTSLDLQIASLVRALERGTLTSLPADKVRHKLEVVSLQSNRLAALINDLLDVSRISSGRLVLAPERMDLRTLVDEVVARFQEQSLSAHSPLETSDDGPAEGVWDSHRIDQVLTNILSNALKYGAGKPIRLELRQTPSTVRVSVADEGIGIPAADHARIFERFERASSARHFGGIGLGLWISKQIGEAHGGNIWLTSEPNRGSTFTVELPKVIPVAPRP